MRDNSIINRLNKTKVIREVDHEAVHADRIKQEAAARKMAFMIKVHQPTSDVCIV